MTMSANIPTYCPIPGTHSRLHQAHRLWHQTLSEYPDPEGFTTNLNATLQALRSITFVLQKEREAIPDFEKWYEQWRERLKQDLIMKWLINARNQIEKEGDLSTHSLAMTSVLAGWDGHVVIAAQTVNPLATTEDLIKMSEKLKLPDEVRRDGVLVIERSWIVQDFPTKELLELLAHGYGVLSTLIEDAHKQRGLIMKTFQDTGNTLNIVSDEHLGGRLPCMIASVEARTVRIHLGLDQLIEPARVFVKADPAKKEEVLARYKAADSILEPRNGESYLDWARQWFERAKVVLTTDGHHLPIAMLMMPDGKPEINALKFDDRQAIYVIMYRLALHVEQTGAVAMIMINEFWEGTEEELKNGIRPSESPHRKEALQVQVGIAEGQLRTYSAQFWRDHKGKIIFGETRIFDLGSHEHWGALEPIHQVWKQWRTRREGH